MFLTIANVLSERDLSRATKTLEKLTWGDGARTAGGRAKRVKHNEQADLSGGVGAGLHDFLLEAVRRSPVFLAAARPKQYSRLLVNRCADGGGYGAHVDNAIMRSGSGRLRTDLSFTLFLSEPDSYEGGELVIDLPGGEQAVKAAAGDLVLYPSGAIHRVEPVTSGVRLACVGWVQSNVRGAAERDVLFDLENVRASLTASLQGDAAELLALDKVVSNLLRLWAD